LKNLEVGKVKASWKYLEANNKMKGIVQLKNPKTGKYIKIDRRKGQIIDHKQTCGPYKDIPIVKEVKVLEVRP
jgi:hypothetical protein